MTATAPHRRRLPTRRPAITEEMEVAGQRFVASVGFCPETGRPLVQFLDGGKAGSNSDALLADTAVAISVALQHGISAQALAKSFGRLPDGPVTPASA